MLTSSAGAYQIIRIDGIIGFDRCLWMQWFHHQILLDWTESGGFGGLFMAMFSLLCAIRTISRPRPGSRMPASSRRAPVPFSGIWVNGKRDRYSHRLSRKLVSSPLNWQKHSPEHPSELRTRSREWCSRRRPSILRRAIDCQVVSRSAWCRATTLHKLLLAIQWSE